MAVDPLLRVGGVVDVASPRYEIVALLGTPRSEGIRDGLDILDMLEDWGHDLPRGDELVVAHKCGLLAAEDVEYEARVRVVYLRVGVPVTKGEIHLALNGNGLESRLFDICFEVYRLARLDAHHELVAGKLPATRVDAKHCPRCSLRP